MKTVDLSYPDATIWSMRTSSVSTQDADVLLYVGSRLDLDEATSLAATLDGIVLSGAGAFGRAGQLRRNGFGGLLLVDPAQYARDEPGAEQLLLDVGVDPLSLQAEVQSSLFLVPAMEYVGANDTEALERVLANGSRQSEACTDRPSAAVVPLDASWLIDGLPGLLKALERFNVRVALALGDPNDPLAKSGAIEGLLTIIRERPDTILLRSDFGVIGAIAHGAALGAIGLTTTHRHAVQPGGFAGGRRKNPTLRVVHPSMLTFFSADVLERVRHIDPGCACLPCGGAPLDRFVDPALRSEANRHNVAIWKSVRDQILSVDGDQRPPAWRNLCDEAVRYEKSLGTRAGINALVVDAQIRRWAKVRL